MEAKPEPTPSPDSPSPSLASRSRLALLWVWSLFVVWNATLLFSFVPLIAGLRDLARENSQRYSPVGPRTWQYTLRSIGFVSMGFGLLLNLVAWLLLYVVFSRAVIPRVLELEQTRREKTVDAVCARCLRRVVIVIVLGSMVRIVAEGAGFIYLLLEQGLISFP